MLLATVGAAQAQVTNYALSLDGESTVDCGIMPALDGLHTYTVQFWICPDKWTAGAAIVSRGGDFAATLGDAEGTVNMTVGSNTLALSSADLKAGAWAQLTVVCTAGSAVGYVNNVAAGSATLGTIPASGRALTLGGSGYTGRIDEVRLWKAALADDFDRFTFNTLNKWAPQWADLIAYYKMDQDLCTDALVDYRILGHEAELDYNNHGIFLGNARRAEATDNTLMPYLINAAYTANERFFDRLIPREQYLLSNDLIILGVQSYSDGHLEVVSPNNHGTLTGTAKQLGDYEGRTGVLALDGSGTMELPAATFNPAGAYSFETWIYLDEWTDGAMIFSKESADGTQGISVGLGYVDDDNKETVVIRVNGSCFRYYNILPTGGWHHLAITIGSATTATNTFAIAVDGVGKNAPRSKYFDGSTVYTPSGAADQPLVVGKGLKGKLDETVFWNQSFGTADFASHSVSVPQVTLTTQQTAQVILNSLGYYRYDDADMPGRSYHSQDEWKRIMESAYDGYRGYHTYISVKSHSGWENTITDATKRQRFAADLAAIAEPYDGVELDLEWVYSASGWTTYHELSKAIRAALPQGKGFRVSTHNVTYAYPVSGMDIVDGFTFQQYGPQKNHFLYSTFESYCKAFVNYGYPRNKIMTSYSTTTSNGDGVSSGSPIKGVKDGFFTDDYVPGDNEESKVMGGETYWFTGPLQTYKRARYTVANNLQGIFYWDMGNDNWEVDADGRPVMPKYNLAKYCSYGLNANVDTLITKVEIRHISDLAPVAIDDLGSRARLRVSATADGSALNVALSSGEAIDELRLYSPSGALAKMVARPAATVDVASLPAGAYILTARTARGQALSEKFMKK